MALFVQARLIWLVVTPEADKFDGAAGVGKVVAVCLRAERRPAVIEGAHAIPIDGIRRQPQIAVAGDIRGHRGELRPHAGTATLSGARSISREKLPRSYATPVQDKLI